MVERRVTSVDVEADVNAVSQRRITSIDIEVDINNIPQRKITSIDIEVDINNIPQRRITQLAIEADIAYKIVRAIPEIELSVETRLQFKALKRLKAEVEGIYEQTIRLGGQTLKVVSEVMKIIENAFKGPIAFRKVVNEIVGIYEAIKRTGVASKVTKNELESIPDVYRINPTYEYIFNGQYTQSQIEIFLIELANQGKTVFFPLLVKRMILRRRIAEIARIIENTFFGVSILVVKPIAEIIGIVENSKTRTLHYIFARVSEIIGIVENIFKFFTNDIFDFDDGLLPGQFITNNWTVVTTGAPHSGTHHLKSGSISNNESSAITLSARTQNISFAWKSSCASGNYGEFYIDGVSYAEIDNTASSYAVVNITGLANTIHIFEWRYAKTSATVSGDDCIYLDSVHVSSATAKSTNSTYRFEQDLTDFSTTSWTRNTSVAYNGLYSLRTGAISHSQTSTLTLIRKTRQIGFWIRGSSENTNDYIRFQIDGNSRFLASGTGKYNREGWTFIFYYDLPYSTHTFTWEYVKSITTSSGSDAYWIDNVEWKNESGFVIVNEIESIVEGIRTFPLISLRKIISEVVGILETKRSFNKAAFKIINEIEAIIESLKIRPTVQTTPNVIKVVNEIEGIVESSRTLASSLFRRIFVFFE